jgi:hypothetical protein
MTRYLISFDDGSMTFPEEDFPAVADGPYPETKAVIGGFSIIEVPSRDEALMWAAKIASSCRCAQEVREIMYDPES